MTHASTAYNQSCAGSCVATTPFHARLTDRKALPSRHHHGSGLVSPATNSYAESQGEVEPMCITVATSRPAHTTHHDNSSPHQTAHTRKLYRLQTLEYYLTRTHNWRTALHVYIRSINSSATSCYSSEPFCSDYTLYVLNWKRQSLTVAHKVQRIDYHCFHSAPQS